MSDRLRVLHLLPHARSLGGTERTVLDLLRSPELANVDQRVAFVQPGRVIGFPPRVSWAGGAASSRRWRRSFAGVRTSSTAGCCRATSWARCSRGRCRRRGS